MALIASCSLATPLWAAKEGGAADAVEEIIVTAQRTSQSSQKVPLAITALSGDFLEKSNVQGFNDLRTRAPSLTYDEFAPGQPRYSIRGIGNTNKSSGVDPGVALFVDDVYMGRPAMTSTDFSDLDRVEILRGPQGTLFGRNATGGAISFFTRRPDDRFGFEAKATAGNYDLFSGSVLLTGPLSETLSGKITVSARRHDGYAYNETTRNDIEDERYIGARAALRWQPNDAWDIQLNVDGSRRRGTGPWWDLAVEGAGSIGKSNPNPRRGKNYPDDGYADIDNYGVSLNSVWTGDIGTITSITAWRHSQNDNRANSTGLNVLPLTDPNRGSLYHTLFIQQDNEKARQFSQEIRLASQIGDRFRLITGAFFYHDNVDHLRLTDYEFVNFGPGLAGRYQFDANNKTTGYALFANGTYELTDQLSLEAGIRWSHDRKKHVVTGSGANYSRFRDNGVTVPGYTAPASASWSAATPMVSLKYQIQPAVMMYGTISRGFKSGGFNDTDNDRVSALRPFNPEYVWNYEVGLKSEWFNRRLQFNAATFYMRYTDLQVSILTSVDPALPAVPVNGNAGKTTIKGAELELTAVPVRGWNIYANYTYTDGKIKELNTGSVDYAGNRLPRVPKHKYFIGTSISQPVGDLTVTGRVDYSYQTSYYASIQNLVTERSLKQKNLDAGVTIDLPGDRWSVELWGKNLTNELNINSVTDVLGDAFATYTPPRTYGATVKFRY
ncbi:TonB-dependent receptor [Rhizorhabdus wittichii]|uniref:TonB-dependent receptor n=1 Tax=Rhizorhabdus wittichii TaxID=160791 RepID=UPI001D00349F|nr:TonB-dependent receptor [Rhizorhabdus wittichii]